MKRCVTQRYCQIASAGGLMIDGGTYTPVAVGQAAGGTVGVSGLLVHSETKHWFTRAIRWILSARVALNITKQKW